MTDAPVARAPVDRALASVVRQARIPIEPCAIGVAQPMLGAAETTVADAGDTLHFARATRLTAAKPVHGARDCAQVARLSLFDFI